MALVLKFQLFKSRHLLARNIGVFGKFAKEKEYKRCYQLLEIDENCDQEQIRLAYLRLVKRFHPDSGTSEANPDKFHEIDKAFKTLIKLKSKERWEAVAEEAAIIVEEQDIKHTAPQHRQYLSFDGVGHGTPFQRQKQYAKVRAMQAAENVYQHRVARVTADDKALLDKTPAVKHKIKTKYGFDRLVEDLIQESMSKGEFHNLSGCGKPLKDHSTRNPYVDLVTHKLNEVLIDNGFTPDWILLQKEIRQEAQQLRQDLLMERQYFGPYPLNIEDNIEWSEQVYKYRSTVDQINIKIAKFNLVVPVLDKQMIQICLEKEAQRAMVQGKCYQDVRFETGLPKKKEIDNNNKSDSVNLFTIFDHLFKGSK